MTKSELIAFIETLPDGADILLPDHGWETVLSRNVTTFEHDYAGQIILCGKGDGDYKT